MKNSIQVLCLLIAVSSAGPVLAEDLLEIYREAQISDARFAAAKAEFLARQERLPEARAGLRPNVNFEAGLSYNDIDVQYEGSGGGSFNSGQRDYTAYDYGLVLNQPVYRQQNWLTVDRAYVEVAQASTELDLAAQDLILRTAQAYFDILLARANLEFERSQEIAVARQLEEAAPWWGKRAPHATVRSA